MKEDNIVNFRLTEKALSLFSNADKSPAQYAPNNGNTNFIYLYNLDKETVVQGRNKWVAFDQKPTVIKTGIKLALKKNQIALVRELDEIVESGLQCRSTFVLPSETNELKIYFQNLGENDVVIPMGAKLPVCIIVVSAASKFNIISDLEYLEATQKI